MAMVQAVSYNFSTVENPLSDGGVFTIVADTNFTGSLKVIAGNLCEVVTTGAASVAFYSGAVAAPNNAWPADQYSEITLTNWSVALSYAYLLVRQGVFNSGTQYSGFLDFTNQAYTLNAIVAGTVHALVSSFLQASAQTDVFRLGVVGNVITLYRNGSSVKVFTDTNNYVTAGSPGFGFFDTTAITDAQTSLWAAGANQAATPTFSPVAGSYATAQNVAITSATPGGIIYYTLDGSTPTHASLSVINGGTVFVNNAETLKAVESVANNLDSAVGSAVYSGALAGGNFVQSFRDFVNKHGNDDTPPKYW